MLFHLVLFLFIFCLLLYINTVYVVEGNIVAYDENLLLLNLVYTGKIIYFSNYIFDILLSLNKRDFISENGSLPPFNYFYSKVVFPSGEHRWCAIFFNDTSKFFDQFFPSPCYVFQRDWNSLDWKEVFFW